MKQKGRKCSTPDDILLARELFNFNHVQNLSSAAVQHGVPCVRTRIGKHVKKKCRTERNVASAHGGGGQRGQAVWSAEEARGLGAGGDQAKEAAAMPIAI